MKRYALIGAAVIALSAAVASAQPQTPPTPEIPLVEVKVGTRTFQVDPFYVFSCVPVHQDTDLGATPDAPLDVAFAMQCFIRVDGEMTPIEEFPTDDSGIMADVGVGEWLDSHPQDPLDGESDR